MGQPLRTRGATAALGLALALGALSACSDDDPEPKFDDPTSEAAPHSSSTPTVTESTTDATEPTEPTEPTTSEAPEQETAEEFIRRWAALEAEMENTGDTKEYASLSKECDACTDLVALVEGYYQAGGNVSWEGWDIRSVERYEGSDKDWLVSVDSAPTRYREEAGGPVKRFAGGPAKYVLTLARSGDGWAVAAKMKLVS